MSLFKKAAVFTDIHFGLKHNSKTHNQDCIDFVEWFCRRAQERGCETALFLGDWHHHRNTINVDTLNYTHKALEMLSNSFEKVYIIAGNHDLYYREKRDVHSMPMANLFDNIIVIDNIFIQDEVAIIPWLVHEEWKDIKKIDCKYMFGHFELPGFKLNAMIEMPDHGGLNKTHFAKPDYVFTGHFHKRQYGQNVHYIGNPFGHNYADEWDFDRGAMFLDWGGEPEYVNWEAGPKYLSVVLSHLIEEPDSILLPKAHIKVAVDVELSYEEMTYMRETFINQYNIRELLFINKPNTSHEEEVDLSPCKTIDEIIITQLKSVESKELDINKLIEIYNDL